MATNRGVAYIKPGAVEVKSIDVSETADAQKRDRSIRGKEAPQWGDSDGRDYQHLRVRPAYGTRADHGPAGLILGHEITGEIIEKGTDVEMLNVGDLVTVPFNIACGRCRNCREGKNRDLPYRQSRAAGCGVWLCRYGRLGRWTGRIRYGSLCRFQPPQVSR